MKPGASLSHVAGRTRARSRGGASEKVCAHSRATVPRGQLSKDDHFFDVLPVATSLSAPQRSAEGWTPSWRSKIVASRSATSTGTRAVRRCGWPARNCEITAEKEEKGVPTKPGAVAPISISSRPKRSSKLRKKARLRVAVGVDKRAYPRAGGPNRDRKRASP